MTKLLFQCSEISAAFRIPDVKILQFSSVFVFIASVDEGLIGENMYEN